MSERQYTPAEQVIIATTEQVNRLPHKVVDVAVASGRASSPASALQHAVNDLRRAAENMRADAVVAVRHATVYDPNDGLPWRATLIGTAVLLPWPHGHGDPLPLADPQEPTD